MDFLTHNYWGDEFLSYQEDGDPELVELAEEFFNGEIGLPYAPAPITAPNINGIYGMCRQCYGPNSFTNWCQLCNSQRFQFQYENNNKWSSGNKMIDKFILYIQRIASRPSEVIEWIPYERLINIRLYDNDKNYTRGGLVEANWMDGRIIEWDYEQRDWKRRREIGVEVLLRRIDESFLISPDDFLKKIESQFQLNKSNFVIKCLGFTRDPYTGTNFMITQ